MRTLIVGIALLSAVTIIGSDAMKAGPSADLVRVAHLRVVRERATGRVFDERAETIESRGERHARLAPADVFAAPFAPLDASKYVWQSHCTMQTSILATGWNVLDLHTNPEELDEDQAYSAGHCEGALSRDMAFNHLHNRYDTHPPPAEIFPFLDAQDQWLQGQIAANKNTSPFWLTAGLLRRQLRGMLDGINAVPSPTYGAMSYHQLMLLVAMGDMFDLIPALAPSRRENWRAMEKHAFDTWFARSTHCSALIKVADDLSDIYFGHVSWFDFTDTLRVFKRLNLNYRATEAKYIAFSSYPAMLSSFDDYYISDRNLVAIETSLVVFNTSVYDNNINPASVLYWMRVMVANWNAATAPQWAGIVGEYNSGTYNNQWLVVDLNLFKPGQPLVRDTMWIAEQMPGLVATQDVTQILAFGYYPGFNVPMIPSVYNGLGYPEGIATQGPEMNSYQTCVRAEIFRRDQSSVKDLKSFQHMMQYNDYLHDPISNGNPLYAISSRAGPAQQVCPSAVLRRVRRQDEQLEAVDAEQPDNPRL